MKKKQDFVLPFSGLKMGLHTYEYELDQSFFEACKDFDVTTGSGNAIVAFEKKETMMLLSLKVSSKVETNCFRCNEPTTLSVEGKMNVVIKFGDNEELEDELWILPREAYQIDLFQPIYEAFITSLPTRIVHEDKGCNPDVLKYLSPEESRSTKEEIDPRWNELNNLN
ncbi:MAG: YceD family protein [Crocinitomicaceae bacterium]|jgi:uncharacterized metal-binding protein YceD (DUF177 family)